jgi:hypothetical protein
MPYQRRDRMPVKNKDFQRIASSTTDEVLKRERIEDFGFTNMSETEIDTLIPVDQTTMIEDAHRDWMYNPLVFRYIETKNNYVVGDGLTYEAEDEEVQKVLDNYWKHPINKWDKKFSTRIKTMSLVGEMILETEVLHHTGKVLVKNKYPGDVEETFKRQGNDEDLFAIKFKNKPKQQEIIRWIDFPEGGKYVGELFHFPLNSTSFQTRGLSDTFFSRDWNRLYDKSLYTTTKRSGLLLSFIWDITINGAKEEEIDAKFKAIMKNPPKPGSFRVHNELETWEEKTPDLNGRDLREVYDLIKTQILAGNGMPEYFYGTGQNTNLAVARVMSAPFFQSIKERQKFVTHMFSEQFNYVIWNAKNANILPEDVNDTYTITMSDPDQEKANNLADTLFKFAQSVSLLESNGYIMSTEAKAVISLILNQLGIEIQESDDDSTEEVMEKASKYLQGIQKRIKK